MSTAVGIKVKPSDVAMLVGASFLFSLVVQVPAYAEREAASGMQGQYAPGSVAVKGKITSPGSGRKPSVDRSGPKSEGDSDMPKRTVKEASGDKIVRILQPYCQLSRGIGRATFTDCDVVDQLTCPDADSRYVIEVTYPVSDPSDITRQGLPYCTEPTEPVVVEPPAAEPEAPPMPVVTLEDFRRLDIAPSKIKSDSGGFGLIRGNTNFYATEEVQTLNATMLGQQVAIQAIPVEWTWDYGDGSAPRTTTGPGGPQREFNQETSTSHAYQATGTYPVNVSTAYRGQFSVNDGPWIAIPGTASVPSAPLEADIWRSESKNVAEDCHENPDGWACADPFIDEAGEAATP